MPYSKTKPRPKKFFVSWTERHAITVHADTQLKAHEIAINKNHMETIVNGVETLAVVEIK